MGVHVESGIEDSLKSQGVVGFLSQPQNRVAIHALLLLTFILSSEDGKQTSHWSSHQFLSILQ